LDLIISTSTEQWVKDKEAFYNKVEQALSPLGNFVFSTFGVENLKEIREATGLGLKYYEQEETRLMLSKNFEILYSKDEQIVLFFSSAKDILRHLKKTGVNGLQKQHWTKKTVNQLIEKIKEATFVEEGKYKLTYHPSYYILQKK
jgi:malonyl-CoA O-methyltransferase